MIIDERLQVSADQALTGTSLVPSTNHINLGHSKLIARGDPLWWVIVAKVLLDGTSPTLSIAVQTDTVTGFASPTTIYTHPTLAQAAFVAGTRIIIPMPWQNEQFLRLAYTMGGTSPTCTLDAFLTSQDPASWEAFPDAI